MIGAPHRETKLASDRYAQKIKKKAVDPNRKGSGWWRMEDLKAAFKRFADNPDDPEASFFLAKALQMAGQTDQAEDRYEMFVDRCKKRFGSEEAAKQHYDNIVEKMTQAKKNDDKRGGGRTGRVDPNAVTLEDYANMRQSFDIVAEQKKKRKKRCVLS